MYSITEIDQLRTLLQIQKIDDTKYTDEALFSIISQAKTMISPETANETVREDFKRHFEGSVYTTNYYPVSIESVQVQINNENVTPSHITQSGLIYFENTLTGVFSCSYIQSFSNDDIETVILPLSMYIVKSIEGGGYDNSNIKSIREGDISLNFDIDNLISTNAQINHLVTSLRSKYNNARVRLI